MADKLIRLEEYEQLIAGSVAPEGADDGGDAGGFPPRQKKTRVLIDGPNPDETFIRLRDAISEAGNDIYDRGKPVRLMRRADGSLYIQVLEPASLITHVHSFCRPYIKKDGYENDVELPHKVADRYLRNGGDWKLRPLNGITSLPILHNDGEMRAEDGYDPASGMYQNKGTAVQVPKAPSRADADAALMTLRKLFRTFCFADASMVFDEATGIRVVDLSKAPGKDESAALMALLTAVVRASVPLAPATIIRAPIHSGAGTGKGYLVRAICGIAYGYSPVAVAGGGNAEELAKQIGAVLMAGNEVLFLDNLNGIKLKSDTLNSVITERPSTVRILGKSEMVTLNSSAFIVATGNALRPAEDLARRCLLVELDAKSENPEARKFPNDLLADIAERRQELLAACLTIWRWGRINTQEKGLTWGSFPMWSEWVRDPLLALGCFDVAKRIREIKDDDEERDEDATILAKWHEVHGSSWQTVEQLAESVKAVIYPPDPKARHQMVSKVKNLVGVRVHGFVLQRASSAGKRGAKYSVLYEAEKHPHHPHHPHHSQPETKERGEFDANDAFEDDTADGQAKVGWRKRL